jgi:GNAT superfamily N-acetyltransferase
MMIRAAKIEDLPMIAALSGELGFSNDQSIVHQRFQEIKSDSRHAIFVSEMETQDIAGWIHIFPRITLISRTLAEIGGLIVSEKFRRRGIGKKLITFAEAWAYEQKYKGIIVRSDSKRKESHNFYPNVGYDFLLDLKAYIRFF